MPVKNILVIGGGISGLSVLHYLKKKYADQSDIHIQLFEKNPSPGGTIHTVREDNWLFEYGPNGFLDSKLSIAELTRDLGLENELIEASPQTQKRFLLINNQLHAIPLDFISLSKFTPLSFLDKLRIPLEVFLPRVENPDETVYEFGTRHFGKNFTNVFLDPVVQGIYAGDVRRLHLRSIFPKIYEVEQKYGSILKGLICLRRKNPLGGGRLVSFKKGMSQLIERLFERYKDSILLNREVSLISPEQGRFSVHSNQKVYDANELFLCIPSYYAAIVTKNLSEALSTALNTIPYVSIAVVGLVYKKDSFERLPAGFGYLTPATEKREVLGVLFDSQIFPQRFGAETEQFRIMIGGAHHPQIVSKTEKDLLDIAQNEIRSILKFKENEKPIHSFVIVWPKGIPQYNVEEVLVRADITSEIKKIRNFHIVSNYLTGVSLDDCVRNAKKAVEESHL